MKKRILEVTFAGGILFPFVFLAMLSLGRRWVFPGLFPEEWTTAHWAALLGQQSELAVSLLQSLALSLGVATMATILSFWTSRAIAYHRHRGRWLLPAYLPYVFAPVILAACLQFYFIKLGLSGRLAGVLLAQLLITYPFGVIFFTSFWDERMRAIEQLTATLGGTPRQTVRRVVLPLARGALLTCFFQTFLISWFEYGLTTLIGVGKVQTLTVRVFLYVSEANTAYAALAACLLFLPPLVILWFNKRFVFVHQHPEE